MSDFFGAFWRREQQIPPALLEEWQAAATRQASWLGVPHRLSQALVVAPATAFAENGNAIVLFSGKLLNRKELAQDIALPSAPTDAQLILALLQKNSFEHILSRLNGPFALVYFDLRTQHLRLVRDQLGQCFLFHSTLPDLGCAVCSDSLPRLAKLPRMDHAVDEAALADYLSLGYIPAPRTIFQAISKVAPGTEDIGEVSSLLSPHRYWKPNFLPQLKITWEEAKEESRRLLELAIRRLLATHPKADFMLSGGIDSGTVMGLVKHWAPDAAGEAHCVAFAETAYDESDLAAGTARKCGIPLEVKHLTPADIHSLESLIAESGEPFADSSLLPCAAATRATSRKALFTGDGGDEIFGGYRRYQAMLLRSRIPGLLQTIARPPCRLAASLLPNPRDNRSRLANLVRSLNAMSLPPLAAYASFQQVADQKRRNELLAKAQNQNYLDDWQRLAEQVPCANPVQKFNALDLMVYLPDDGFRKTTLAAAGTGVDLLCPILDLDVVRFALALPVEYRFTPHENKRLLRELGKEFLDPRILAQSKRGFGMPAADWFRNELRDDLRELAHDAASWDKLQLIDYKQLISISKEHLAGQANHGALLWAIYCLYLWEKQL